MLPFDPVGESAVVLGYDGSPAAQRALDFVARMLRGRTGWVQVVHVSDDHPTAGADGPSLAEQVQRRLVASGADWRFESRSGVPAVALTSAADDLGREGEHRAVLIVVGRPGSHHADLSRSVVADLVRLSRYPVVVVP